MTSRQPSPVALATLSIIVLLITFNLVLWLGIAAVYGIVLIVGAL